MSRRVLLVDDEETLVWSLARQMQRERPDLSFEGLSDPEQALRRLTEAPPDVLVTDVRMPGMSGLELLLAARRVIPDLPVVVVTAYGNADVRAHVQGTPSVQYLEKPFAFSALLAAIEHALAQPTGFSGAISLPMLPDLIQLYALAQTTGTLRITRGAEQGVLWFEHGAITHAECGPLAGPEAVYALLRWEGGGFSVETEAVAPRQTISASWQELLIEGCRRLDEAAPVPAPAGEGLGQELAAWRASARDTWRRLRPLLGGSTSGTLMWAVRLSDQAVEALNGPDEAPLGALVTGLLDRVAAVVGPARRGSGEWIMAESGVVLAWDHGRDLAMVFAGSLNAGPAARARFRSHVVRWCQASGLVDPDRDRPGSDDDGDQESPV
jgi:CheY-like chemotaxis protein